MNRKLHTDIKKNSSPFRELITWNAPERVWSPKNKVWYLSYSLLFLFIITIAAILGEYILIVLVIAFVFLWFIQASIPPEITTHTITSLGIRSFEKLYKWKDIKHYWFSEKKGIKFLHLDLRNDNPNKNYNDRITLLLNDDSLDKGIFLHLVKYVDYGDKEEIGFNILARLIHGKYIDISEYIEEEGLSQEEYLESSAN